MLQTERLSDRSTGGLHGHFDHTTGEGEMMRYLMMLFLIFSAMQEAACQWKRMATFSNASFYDIMSFQGSLIANIEPDTSLGIRFVFRSTDHGGTWTLSQSGMDSSTFGPWLYTHVQTDSILFVGTNKGLYKTTDGGRNWVKTGNGLTFEISPQVVALHLTDDRMYAGIDGSRIFESTDMGETWTFLHQFYKYGNKEGRVEYITSIGEILFARVVPVPHRSTYISFYRSSDRGKSWTELLSGTTDFDQEPRVFSFHTKLFRIQRGSGSDKLLYVSTDTGLSWEVLTPGLSGGSTKPRRTDILGTNLFCVVQPADPATISMIVQTTDGGESWLDISSGYDLSSSPRCITHDELYLYVGTSHWIESSRHGLWRRPLSELVSVGSEKASVPAGDALGWNYPNPFTRVSTVSYTLSARSSVSVRLYDALGRLRRTIIEEEKDAGAHKVELNAGSLPGGIYFYVLESGTGRIAKPCVIVR